MQLKDQVAVVTGGASGIGEALCERFAQEGARHVVVVDRDEARAMEVAARIGGSAAALDVSDGDAIRSLVADTEAAHGRIDCFFSNAGYVTLGGLEAPVSDLEQMFRVHVTAHLHAARAVIPGMVRRGGGTVVNTASAAGLLSQFGSLHYSITKHAAVALAEWIAITHGHQGIQVAVLCPQAVETRIGENSPDRDRFGADGGGVASGDGVRSSAEVAEVVVEGLAEGRFWLLPHPEVGEYAKRKADDVDRWIGGMQRWQGRMFTPASHPARWLVGDE